MIRALVVVTILAAAPAHAEDLPSSTTLAVSSAAPDAQLLALQAEIAQVEQRARLAEERAQAAEQKASAASEAPVVGVSDRGFALRSPDDAFSLRIKGLLDFDGRAFLGDATARNGDGFIVRKIRPVFEATVLKWADVRFMPDFANSKLVVVDAFVDVRPSSWLKIRAGKFIAPVGLERSEQDTELAFMERSLTSNLTQVRDLGVVAYLDLWGGFIHLAGGFLDGGPDNVNLDLDNNQGKDLAGRVWLQPFKPRPELGALAVGVSGSAGTHRGTVTDSGLGAFVTPGQSTFFSYLTTAPDVVHADGAHRRFNPQLFYYVGPAGLLAEYSVTQQRVTRADASAFLTHRAWHATANYVFGGLAGLNGVTVTNPFLPAQGKLGALELALRVGQLRVDPDAFPTFADPARSARGALEVGGAASLYFNRNFKLSLNYEQVEFQAAAGSLTRPRERVFLARTQFLF
jgi:phosphate-selective porin OprO/OprP